MHSHQENLPTETKISKVKPVEFTRKKHRRLFVLDDDRTTADIAPKELNFHDLRTSDSRQVSSSHPGQRAPNQSQGRPLSHVGAYAVQCASCFKWRLVPTKQKYEEIRENLLEDYFVCKKAQEWRPDVSCDDPADISPEGNRLWAIDKPNITRPPTGWERIIKIRGERSAHFADVYYTSPAGKRLRSMVEVEKYLLEHPEFVDQGVKVSQFSFKRPRPWQENSSRPHGRSSNARRIKDGVGSSNSVEPDVNPLPWSRPDASTVLQLGRP